VGQSAVGDKAKKGREITSGHDKERGEGAWRAW